MEAGLGWAARGGRRRRMGGVRINWLESYCHLVLAQTSTGAARDNERVDKNRSDYSAFGPSHYILYIYSC